MPALFDDRLIAKRITPGPWRVHRHYHARGEMWLSINYGAWDVTHNKDDGQIAACKYSAMSEEENLGNAYVMAAAPELLAACEQARAALLELLGADYDVAGDISALDAAIAKAKGDDNASTL